MLTMVIRGLPKSMTQTTLEGLFTPHGRIFDVKISKDLFSGECKGFAELKMEGHEARLALAALNGSTHDGSTIRVALHDLRRAQKSRR